MKDSLKEDSFEESRSQEGVIEGLNEEIMKGPLEGVHDHDSMTESMRESLAH